MKCLLPHTNADVFCRLIGFDATRELALCAPDEKFRVSWLGLERRRKVLLQQEEENLAFEPHPGNWLDLLANTVGFQSAAFICQWFDYDVPELDSPCARGEELRKLILAPTTLRDKLIAPSDMCIAQCGTPRKLTSRDGSPLKSDHEIYMAHKKRMEQDPKAEQERLTALRKQLAKRIAEVYASWRGRTVTIPRGIVGSTTAINFQLVLRGIREKRTETVMIQKFGVPSSSIRKGKALFAELDIK